MAKAVKHQTQPDTTADIERFAKQATIEIDRLDHNRVRVHTAFAFRELKYEISGHLDLARQRPEPFVHQITWKGNSVIEMTVITGQDHSRVEYKFGKATTGVRTAIVNIERLKQGSLITGVADGDELIPYRSGGCHCLPHSGEVTHPLLAWTDATSTRAVTLELDSQLTQPLEGLGHVIRLASDALNNGDGLGDIVDVLTYLFCLLECVGETIICWLGTLGKPGSGTFQVICSVLWGECCDICWIPISF